jgi:hypothetical protein
MRPAVALQTDSSAQKAVPGTLLLNMLLLQAAHAAAASWCIA